MFKNYGPKKYPDYKVNIRLDWEEERIFNTYQDLDQYIREHDDTHANESNNPFMFDLKRAVTLIDKYGQELEQFELFRPALPGDEPHFIQIIGNLSLVPARFDLCDCKSLLKCPNGTETKGIGAISDSDCLPLKKVVLRRLPFRLINNDTETTPRMFNQTDFNDLSGANIPIGTLELQTFDVAVFNMDLSKLPRNITFHSDIRLSIYKNCKPCPTQYTCAEDGTACSDLSNANQFELFNNCLKREKVRVCVHRNGTSINMKECENLRKSMESRDFDSAYLIYNEPDLFKCVSSSYFCSEKTWNYASFRKLCADGPLIYDCLLHEKWKIYKNWMDGMCCSNSASGGRYGSCVDGQCSNEKEMDWNIKQEILNRFQNEFGFEPPPVPPKGNFLMDRAMQENVDNPNVLSLFNFWQGPPNDNQSLLPHNVHNPDISKTWTKSSGCCDCKPYLLPIFFRKNSETSGFPDNKHRYIHFTVSALKPTNITVVLELLNGKFYNEFDDSYLKTSLMFGIHKPIRFSKGTHNSLWLAVVTREVLEKDQLDFPLNLPAKEFEGGLPFDDYLIVDRPCKQLKSSIEREFDDSSEPSTYDDDGRIIAPDMCTVDVFEDTNMKHLLSHDGTMASDFLLDAALLPYLPFFSNCDGFDSHVSLSRLMEEHPDCHLSSPQETKYVRQMSFGDNRPHGDHCQSQFPFISSVSFGNGANLFCQYEENVKIASDRVRWFEASSGLALFYLTQDALTAEGFNQTSNWINSRYTKPWTKLDGQHENTDIIPVVIHRGFGGIKNAIPRKIVLELQYYQKDHFTKRLVSASIYFSELCTTVAPDYFGGDPDVLSQMKELGILPCDVDINGRIKSTAYELDIQIYPLVWSQLLNKFEFNWVIYFCYFTVAGVFSLIIGIMIWVIMRISTKLRFPPNLKGVMLFKTVALPALYGNTLSILTSGVYLIVSVKLFLSENSVLNGLKGHWLNTSSQPVETVQTTRAGRCGLVMLILGVIMIISVSSILIPIPRENTKAYLKDTKIEMAEMSNSDQQKVYFWKRTQFLVIWFIIQICLVCTWEYSYSLDFEDNIFRLIVLAKIAFCFLELCISRIIQEKLLAFQLLVPVSISEVILTVGSFDFIDFTVLYLLQTVLSICYRLYFDPFIKVIYSLLPRWYLMTLSVFKSQHKRTLQKAEDERRIKQVNENIQMRMEGVDPLLDSMTLSSMNISTRLLTPCVLLLISSFYDETLIAQNHRISARELLYYIIFSLCMIPWSLIIDVFVLHAEELLHGWRLFDYLVYQRHRFKARDCKWTLHNPYVDESISFSFQTLDLMGFSSQYYFASGIVATSSIMAIVGTTTLLRQESYNAFSDPVLGILIIGILLLSKVLRKMIIHVGSLKISYLNWEGVWGDVNIEDSADDIIVTKLATGEAKHVDLEKERLEVKAIENNHFRELFLERNKPWILRHLSELFENYSFDDSDERLKLLDYSKQAYSALLQMEGKERRPGERNDISSDSDNDSFAGRRNWSRHEFGLIDISIAQLWLKKAKKRGVYSMAIEKLLSSNSLDYCSRCRRTQSMCTDMHSVLTDNGSSRISVDSLIDQYEQSHAHEIYDEVLWKSFVLKNASVIKLCYLCISSRETLSTHFGMPEESLCRKTRSGDISSDSDEDEIMRKFDPVIIISTDVRARILVKWLQAARQYLGGAFPRKQAEPLCRKYLDNLQKYHRTLKHDEGMINSFTGGRDDICRLNEYYNDAGDISEIETSIITRWLRNSKHSTEQKLFHRGNEIRNELSKALSGTEPINRNLEIECQTLISEGDALSDEFKVASDEKDAAIRDLHSESETSIAELELRKKTLYRNFEEKLTSSLNDIERENELRRRDVSFTNSELRGIDQEDFEHIVKGKKERAENAVREELAKELTLIDLQIKTKRYWVHNQTNFLRSCYMKVVKSREKVWQNRSLILLKRIKMEK